MRVVVDVGANPEYGLDDEILGPLPRWLFCPDLDDSLDRANLATEWSDEGGGILRLSDLLGERGHRADLRLGSELRRLAEAGTTWVAETEARLDNLIPEWVDYVVAPEGLIGHLVMWHGGTSVLPLLACRDGLSVADHRKLHHLHRTLHGSR